MSNENGHVVGIGGQMQMGKSTLAEFISKRLGYKNLAFASNVKKIFSDTFGVSLDFIEEWKLNPDAPPGYGLSVRKGLQLIGDGFRQIRENVWIDLILNNVSGRSLIGDIRYINEMKAIRQHGGTNVLVWRPGKENNDPNGSEAQIRPLLDFFVSTGIDGKVELRTIDNDLLASAPHGVEFVDFFIRNEGTVEDLHQKAEKLLVPHLEAE